MHWSDFDYLERYERYGQHFRQNLFGSKGEKNRDINLTLGAKIMQKSI